MSAMAYAGKCGPLEAPAWGTPEPLGPGELVRVEDARIDDLVADTEADDAEATEVSEAVDATDAVELRDSWDATDREDVCA